MRIMSIFNKSSVPIWLASQYNYGMKWNELNSPEQLVDCTITIIYMYVDLDSSSGCSCKWFRSFWISSSVSAHRQMRKMKRKYHINTKLELFSDFVWRHSICNQNGLVMLWNVLLNANQIHYHEIMLENFSFEARKKKPQQQLHIASCVVMVLHSELKAFRLKCAVFE